MPDQSVIIVGLGEVGQTLFDLFKKSRKFEVFGLDLDKSKMQRIAGNLALPESVDVMHVCYPCRDQEVFVNLTMDYLKKFRPKLTIIESTVNPGTTQKIYQSSKMLIAHSPVRGMHKTLETMMKDMLFWRKYVGGATREAAEMAKNHFERLGLKVRVLKGPAETELAKLFETVYRAWMIACFQEMHRISRHFGAGFNDVVDMIEDIHRVDRNKPLHYPDVIAGHCLIPNTELLLKSYDSEFLRLILESNEKRKKEVKDKGIRDDIEEVKKRTVALERETGTREN